MMAAPTWIKTLLTPGNLKGGGTALAGMVVGAVVGIAVQAGVESTGMLGPSVDSLLAEQQENFNEMHLRLDSIRTSTDDPGLNRELTQLAELIHQQDALRQRANTELAFLGGQVATLREDSIAERGFAGGADFWLKPGESVSIGDSRHVLGVIRTWQTAVDVVVNNEKSRLSVGGMVSTDDCDVFFKQSVAREDGRVGFDVACS